MAGGILQRGDGTTVIRDLLVTTWLLLVAGVIFLGLLLIGLGIMMTGESPKTAWKEIKNIAVHKLN